MMDPTTDPRLQERRAYVERMRRSRASMLRLRWVMVALGGLLAAALLAKGSYVIGGTLAVLLVARIVLITRMQRLWNQREAAFGHRFGATGGPTGGNPIDV
jgi:hypothetical protein